MTPNNGDRRPSVASGLPDTTAAAHATLADGEMKGIPWYRATHVIKLNFLLMSPFLTIIAWG